MRMITIAVPEAYIAEANNLGMAKGYSPADGLSYRSANWQDAFGNRFATTSLPRHLFAEDPLTPCVRPKWDSDGVVDMALATEAQSRLDVIVYDSEQTYSTDPATITVMIGPMPLDALRILGLTLIEEDEPAAWSF